jgi:drug/metabolite transporter (DMT)-like permease
MDFNESVIEISREPIDPANAKEIADAIAEAPDAKKAKDIKGIENASLQLLIAFVTVAVFVAVTRGFNFNIDTASILPALVLGLFNTGFGCYLYFSSIGKLPVQSVAICGCIELLSAVVFSMIFLNEVMLLPQVVGGILIIGGTVVSELRREEKKPPTNDK